MASHRHPSKYQHPDRAVETGPPENSWLIYDDDAESLAEAAQRDEKRIAREQQRIDEATAKERQRIARMKAEILPAINKKCSLARTSRDQQRGAKLIEAIENADSEDFLQPRVVELLLEKINQCAAGSARAQAFAAVFTGLGCAAEEVGIENVLEKERES
ncbi:uncharacterized protein RCC_07534 [Ramularia collo-cygni]|uniref:Uncharacterized protein n=1 Tax=Ramularia collo-cygni TaxID=112498 RepID=A0A2D3VI58_9PEZI|nr:uncharacterized protein RCC_07534 [Ramularia collo-cygni]CZT21669.1 uncharacterized protein RCC_07534 [Ramularia collo-cygni]